MLLIDAKGLLKPRRCVIEPSVNFPKSENGQGDDLPCSDPDFSGSDGPAVELNPPRRPCFIGSLAQFDIVRRLGTGGMGVVFLAQAAPPNPWPGAGPSSPPAEPQSPCVASPRVALKTVKPGLQENQQAIEAFIKEAHNQQQLVHSHILPVLAVEHNHQPPFIILPFIAGGSLAKRIRLGELMPTDEILRIAIAIASALTYAHKRGIIHRDLKPSNILIEPTGQVYVADFGLSRSAFNDSIHDGQLGHRTGTAPYMSPAVAAGEAEYTRADIYSFGAVLYEMLTGRPPYQGSTESETIQQIMAGPPTPIHKLNPSAPSDLAQIAETAMARELRDRYAQMGDVLANLQLTARGWSPLGAHGRPTFWRRVRDQYDRLRKRSNEL